MKVAIVCPASFPATQFGGIVFLAVDLAREISELGHDVTIYTTDLDFSNGPNKFNKELPRNEKLENFMINRTHSWLSIKLFFINPSIYKQILKDKPDIIHTIGLPLRLYSNLFLHHLKHMLILYQLPYRGLESFYHYIMLRVFCAFFL